MTFIEHLQCDEPYQESQESIEIGAQDDEEIIRLGSADKFNQVQLGIIETFDSSTPAERYSPPTPKEKKSRVAARANSFN